MSKNQPDDIEADAPRACPMCRAELEPGTVSIHGTMLGWLSVGWSYQHLWFYQDGKEEAVLKSGHTRKGYRCRGCGFVGVAGDGDGPA
jgi:hypothetical protein